MRTSTLYNISRDYAGYDKSCMVVLRVMEIQTIRRAAISMEDVVHVNDSRHSHSLFVRRL